MNKDFNKYTAKKVGHVVYHFGKCALLGWAQGTLVGLACSKIKNIKLRMLALAIGLISLAPINYAEAKIEVDNLNDRFKSIDAEKEFDEESEN